MMKWEIPTPYETVAVEYSDLKGVDLASDSRNIDPRRASRLINMYRRYDDGGGFTESRPGYKTVGEFGEQIFGMHFHPITGMPLIHAGSALYLWSTFPDAPTETNLLSLHAMARRKSVSFSVNGNLYILDGESYLCFNGETLSEVTGFVPTTRIGCAPTGGGEKYQRVNLLSNRRINTFHGDGASKDFQLDAKNVDEIIRVTVGGTNVSGAVLDGENGIVTLPSAPLVPPLGEDNVEIEYRKEAQGYYERVAGCTLCCTFDNRVFLSGNPLYPNRIIHCSVNDPSYFADTDYYDDGGSERPVNGLAVKDNTLIAIRSSGQRAVFNHAPTLDYEMGRIYPSRESVITVGCDRKGCALAFRDDLVYLSSQGLEGITDTLSEAAGALNHRSTLVDAMLTYETEAQMAVWNGYLCILAGERMYLADSRGLYLKNSSFEYEWYIWEGLREACYILSYSDSLYFGTADGRICLFCSEGDDDGEGVSSLWQSRTETAGAFALRKSVNKGGCAALLKKLPNSRVEVWARTDDEPEYKLCEVNCGGLDFSDMDFSSLSFGAGNDNLVSLPLNEKVFKTLTLSFKSERPFGIGYLSYIASLIGFIR